MSRGRLSARVRLPQLRDEMASLRERAGQDAAAPPAGRSAAPLIQVSELRMVFKQGTRTVTALDGIPAADWSTLSGKDRRRLRGTVQIVFQDPYSSLNPMHTIGAALAEAVTVHAPFLPERAGAGRRAA